MKSAESRLNTERIEQLEQNLFADCDWSYKTASLVLLFCFGKPVLPIDTHVHRVSQWLGLIGPTVNPTAAHALLLNLFPPEPHVLFNFHISMLKHGQKICIWGTPRCEKCPLTDLCDWYQSYYSRSD